MPDRVRSKLKVKKRVLSFYIWRRRTAEEYIQMKISWKIYRELSFRRLCEGSLPFVDGHMIQARINNSL